MATSTILDTDDVTIEHITDYGAGFYRVLLKGDAKTDHRNKTLGRMEKLKNEMKNIDSKEKRVKWHFWMKLMIVTILALVSAMFYVLTFKGDGFGIFIAFIFVIWLCFCALFVCADESNRTDLVYDYNRLSNEHDELLKLLNNPSFEIMVSRYDSLDRGLEKFFTTGNIADRFDSLYSRKNQVYYYLVDYLEKINISWAKKNNVNS